jgi:hypothetical protein
MPRPDSAVPTDALESFPLSGLLPAIGLQAFEDRERAMSSLWEGDRVCSQLAYTLRDHDRSLVAPHAW